MKFLAFTTDVIPLPGLPTSGTALRTFGLIQGLRAHGHQVEISVPKTALHGMLKSCDRASLSAEVQQHIQQLQQLAFDSANQAHLLSEIRPDAVLCGHWPAYTFQTKPAQPVIIDLAGPHLLERHYQGSPNHAGAVLSKLSAIASADYYIVSGPTQRLYFLSYMLRAQVPQPEKKIFHITMPLDPALPGPRAVLNPADFPRFVFGGVFLPWQNPAAGLERTAEAIRKRGRGSLKLIGGSHPNYKIKGGVYDKLFDTLAKSPAVKTLPMLPYEAFLGELSTSDIAVDLMQWNLERELAMTIRSTSYLWAGVPIIYNDYADLGKLIRRYDAGWTVSPQDEAGLDAVFAEIFENPDIVSLKSQNASRLAREVFSWDRAVRPLLDGFGKQDRVSTRELDIIVDFPDNADLTVTADKHVEQYIFLTRKRSVADRMPDCHA
jgi:glycosyltransferase involved in cell wall biosynthesis